MESVVCTILLSFTLGVLTQGRTAWLRKLISFTSFFFGIFLISPNTFAAPSYCSTLSRLPSNNSDRQRYEQAAEQCRQEYAALQCAVAEKDPNFKGLLRVCTPEAMCAETMMSNDPLNIINAFYKQDAAGRALNNANALIRGCTGIDVKKSGRQVGENLSVFASCFGNRECMTRTLPGLIADDISYAVKGTGTLISNAYNSLPTWKQLGTGALWAANIISPLNVVRQAGNLGRQVSQVTPACIEAKAKKTKEEYAHNFENLARGMKCFKAEYTAHAFCQIWVAGYTSAQVAGSAKSVAKFAMSRPNVAVARVMKRESVVRARADAAGARIREVRRNLALGKPIVAVAGTQSVASNARRETRGAGGTRTASAEPAPKPKPNPGAWRGPESMAQFRARMLDYDPVDDAARVDMMSTVFSSKGRGVKVLDVENAFLKELNDNETFSELGGLFKKDRDLVTALTNQHKQILDERIRAFAEKYKDQLDLKYYSDFKSQRFALIPKKLSWKATGIPDSVLKELDEVYRAANNDFVKKVEKLGITSKVPTDKWFLAGLDASADEANLNARMARELDNGHATGIVRSDTPGVKDLKTRAYNEINDARANVEKLPTDSPLLNNEGGIRLPKPEVFDLVKKSEGDIDKLRETIEANYPGVKLTDEMAMDLQRYAKATDRLQPGIWQTSREVATVAEAKFGGVTFDVGGMGSQNAYQTALQAARCSSPAFIAQCVREGERSVTRDFREKMGLIRDATLQTCVRYKLDCFIRISGDDVVVIPRNGPLPRTFARENLDAINAKIGAGKIRLSEIPKGIAEGPFRVQLGQHGESIEKLMRANLNSGPLAERARTMTFGVRMKTKVPDIGQVQFILSGPGAAGLSAADRATLMKAYRQAVRDFNAKSPGRDYTFSY